MSPVIFRFLIIPDHFRYKPVQYQYRHECTPLSRSEIFPAIFCDMVNEEVPLRLRFEKTCTAQDCQVIGESRICNPDNLLYDANTERLDFQEVQYFQTVRVG